MQNRTIGCQVILTGILQPAYCATQRRRRHVHDVFSRSMQLVSGCRQLYNITRMEYVETDLTARAHRAQAHIKHLLGFVGIHDTKLYANHTTLCRRNVLLKMLNGSSVWPRKSRNRIFATIPMPLVWGRSPSPPCISRVFVDCTQESCFPRICRLHEGRTWVNVQ